MIDPCAFALWTSDFCLLELGNRQVKGKLFIAFHTFEIVAGHSQPPDAKEYLGIEYLFFYLCQYLKKSTRTFALWYLIPTAVCRALHKTGIPFFHRASRPDPDPERSINISGHFQSMQFGTGHINLLQIMKMMGL